jgi:HlyD family secretion protein
LQQLVERSRSTALPPPIPLESLQQQLEQSIKSPPVGRVVRMALLTLGLTLVPFIGWATMTTMERAVISSGQLVPEGRRKTVNLLEPGILRRLLVQEGSVVEAGQPLLQLDVTQAETSADAAKAAFWGGRARAARLRAEQADNRELRFPEDLLRAAASDPAIQVFVAAEQAFFQARWAAFDGQTGVQERAITQLQEQVAGAQAQRQGAEHQVRTVREQIAGYNRLLTQGFASRFTVLNLQQLEAGFVATIGQSNAQEAQLREGIIQAQGQLATMRLTRLAEIANDLQMTEASIATAMQQLRAAQDILARREVLAPEAGKVTNIQAFTPGATIQSGQAILDLVPINDRLIVEGHIQPTDIEQVAVGQRVNIRLTSYRMRSVPLLHGHITVVGADIQAMPNGTQYFMMRAEFEPGALESTPEVGLLAGMPTEVYVLGEKRTPMSYLWAPLLNSTRRSFRD